MRMVDTRDQEETDSSILRNRIRIDGEESSSSKFKSLCRKAGHQWPPRDQAEAVAVLKKAGFSGQRIDQLLHFMGVPGFEGAGELPEGYTSVGKPRFRERALTPDEFSKEFGVPTFTPMLVEGLKEHILKRKVAAATENATADGIDSKPDGDKQELSFFDLNLNKHHETVRRSGKQYERFGPQSLGEDAWNLLVKLRKGDGKLSNKQVNHLLPHHNKDRRNNAAKELRRKLESFDVTYQYDRDVAQWILRDESV